MSQSIRTGPLSVWLRLKELQTVSLAKKILCVAAAMLLVPCTAQGGVIVNNVNANWNNHQGGQNVVYSNSDGQPGNEKIEWGGNSNKSSYVFTKNAPPPFMVNIGDTFLVGKFTHNNFPIPSGSGITAVKLSLNIDGNMPTIGPLDFKFEHNETPNGPGPPDSNDIVKISTTKAEEMFTIGTNEYTLYIDGFSTDFGNTYTSEFSTFERNSNEAGLYGHFGLIEGGSRNVVPEPGAIAIWSVVGLIACRRRRRHELSTIKSLQTCQLDFPCWLFFRFGTSPGMQIGNAPLAAVGLLELAISFGCGVVSTHPQGSFCERFYQHNKTSSENFPFFSCFTSIVLPPKKTTPMRRGLG